jgi:hypothetical protein
MKSSALSYGSVRLPLFFFRLSPRRKYASLDCLRLLRSASEFEVEAEVEVEEGVERGDGVDLKKCGVDLMKCAMESCEPGVVVVGAPLGEVEVDAEVSDDAVPAGLYLAMYPCVKSDLNTSSPLSRYSTYSFLNSLGSSHPSRRSASVFKSKFLWSK